MSLKARILTVLEEGPSPARGVAIELGLDYRRVNAYLCDLWRRGYVSRTPHHLAASPAVRKRLSSVGGFSRMPLRKNCGRAVWCYSVLDADLVGIQVVGAR